MQLSAHTAHLGAAPGVRRRVKAGVRVPGRSSLAARAAAARDDAATSTVYISVDTQLPVIAPAQRSGPGWLLPAAGALGLLLAGLAARRIAQNR